MLSVQKRFPLYVTNDLLQLSKLSLICISSTIRGHGHATAMRLSGELL